MSENLKIAFINRRPCGYVSIERVFEQVSASLNKIGLETFTVTLPYGSGAIGILLNLLSFRTPKSDIYHVTGQTHFICLRLPKERTVLTIHDLRFLDSPSPLKRWLLRKLFLDWPVRRAGIVTAVSETTREAIIRETGCEREKVVVVSNPIRSEFLNSSHAGSSGESRVVLHVGTMPNKNLRNLVTALKGSAHTLHVVGVLDADQRRLLDENIEYVNSTHLGPEAMLGAYRMADVLSFCSTFEGFGLPIIEAQAIGLPVVTSDAAPMKDVAGGAAALVDPSEPSSIRRGIDQVLNDAGVRVELVEGGKENIKRFLPDAIARAYSEIYVRLSEGGLSG